MRRLVVRRLAGRRPRGWRAWRRTRHGSWRRFELFKNRGDDVGVLRIPGGVRDGVGICPLLELVIKLESQQLAEQASGRDAPEASAR